MAADEAGTDLPFYCSRCRLKYRAEPERVVDNPDLSWDPHDYFSACPECGHETAEAAWSRNLRKAHGRATGPTSAEGKRATGQNLAGHPTPEEARRTRFNAMTHGLSAQVATYWPAKPGKYARCQTCEYFNAGCDDEAHRRPGHKNPVACMKRAERFMQVQVAHETQDARMLAGLQSEYHANVHAILSDIMVEIAQDGVALRTPEWYYDKEGGFHLAQYTGSDGEQVLIHKVEAHPLLKLMIDFMAKYGLTLPEAQMTPKAQNDAETLRGFVDQDEEDREDAREARQRQTAMLDNLQGMIERSRNERARDPVLIEHESGQRGTDDA